MTSDLVIVVITYRALPGHGATALRELTALIRDVVALEPDCLGIRVHHDPVDDTRILLYEEWTSRKAYTGPHMQTPHIQAFIGRAREFIAGPPIIEFWELDESV